MSRRRTPREPKTAAGLDIEAHSLTTPSTGEITFRDSDAETVVFQASQYECESVARTLAFCAAKRCEAQSRLAATIKSEWHCLSLFLDYVDSEVEIPSELRVHTITYDLFHSWVNHRIARLGRSSNTPNRDARALTRTFRFWRQNWEEDFHDPAMRARVEAGGQRSQGQRAPRAEWPPLQLERMLRVSRNQIAHSTRRIREGRRVAKTATDPCRESAIGEEPILWKSDENLWPGLLHLALGAQLDKATLQAHLPSLDLCGEDRSLIPHELRFAFATRDPLTEILKRAYRAVFFDALDLAACSVHTLDGTGRRPEELHNLPAKDVTLMGERVHVVWTKNAARKTYDEDYSTRSRIQPGWALPLLLEATAPLRTISGSDRLYLVPRIRYGEVTVAKPSATALALKAWLAEHGLNEPGARDEPAVSSTGGGYAWHRFRKSERARTVAADPGNYKHLLDHSAEVFHGHYVNSDVLRTQAADTLVTAQDTIGNAVTSGALSRLVVDRETQQLLAIEDQEAAQRVGVPISNARALSESRGRIGCIDVNNSPFSQGEGCFATAMCLLCRNARITPNHAPLLEGLKERYDAGAHNLPISIWVQVRDRVHSVIDAASAELAQDGKQ